VVTCVHISTDFGSLEAMIAPNLVALVIWAHIRVLALGPDDQGMPRHALADGYRLLRYGCRCRHSQSAWRPVATSRSTRARRFALPDHGADERTHEAIEAFLEGPEARRHRPSPRRRPRKGYPNTGSDTGTAAQGTATVSKADTDPKPDVDPKTAEAPEAGNSPNVNEAATASKTPTNGASAATASAVVIPATESRAMPAVRPVTDIRTIPGRLEFNTALERESLRAARYGRPAAVAIVELVPVRMNQAIDIWLRSLAGPVSRTLRKGTRATDLVARVANARFQVLLPETPETGAGRFAERVTSACQSSIDESGAPVSVRVTIAAATPEHPLHEALSNALQSIEAA
jgi:GGDEF domain-containing protein